MTTFVDTGRPGKKRYRVRWQGEGGSRTAEFSDGCERDAYREFYHRERFAWEGTNEDRISRKRSMTLKELLMLYYGQRCEDVELNRISRSYFRAETGRFNRLKALFNRNSPPLWKISSPDLARITDYNTRVFVRRAYSLAIEIGICTKNPCTLPRKALRYSMEIPLEKFATPEQVKTLMTIGNAFQRLAVYLGAACGMRISEVAALRWDNVHPNKIVIDSHLTEAGILPGLKQGTRNVLPVGDDFQRLLSVIPRTGKYIFEKQKGGAAYASIESFRVCVLKGVLEKAGMKAQGKSFHALRHYAVSTWVERGIRLEQISAWLDHSSSAVTLAVYAHLFTHSDHLCYLDVDL